MDSEPQSFLVNGELLSINEYLLSPNHLFYAILQDDGNFCVYHGSTDPGPYKRGNALWCWTESGLTPNSGPYFAILQADGNFCVYHGNEPANQGQSLWCRTETPPPPGPHFAIMQDDGNFCVYHGNDPTKTSNALWCSGRIDPIVDVNPIDSIVYDVSNAKTLGQSPTELYRQLVTNTTSRDQTSTISGSEEVAEMHGWSDTLGFKVGVETSFKTGIPIIAEGKVTISAETSNTYTWSGSTETKKTWSFNTPVTVPPKEIIVVIVTATTTTIAVPYTLTGTLVHKSGKRFSGQIKGIYTGSNSHDLTVTFHQVTPSGETTSSIRPLNATAAVISPTS